MSIAISTSLKTQKSLGFSLIEMSIILTAFAVLMTGLLMSRTVERDAKLFVNTDNKLEKIEEALKYYYSFNDALPCPASVTTSPDAAAFGTSTDCTVNGVSGTFDIDRSGSDQYALRRGMIPTRTLGLPDEYAIDEWGNRISYVVLRQLTVAGAADTFTPSQTTDYFQVVDQTGSVIAGSSTSDVPAFFLFSHGADGKGAYSKEGTSNRACGSKTDSANCGSTKRFVAAPVNDTSITTNYFYDVARMETLSDLTPVAAAAAPSTSANWVFINAGRAYSCGILANGKAYCWGDNWSGKLGDGTSMNNRYTPVLVSGGYTDWTYLALGESTTCGLRANGRAYCWGANWSGQIGDGTTTNRLVPTEVSGGYTDWTDISIDFDATCGVRGGRAYCWGWNTTFIPTEEPGGYTDWVSISRGFTHTCGRRSNGRAYCWGDNWAGQIGENYSGASTSAPLEITGNYTDWTNIEASNYRTCGVRGGRAYCWGGYPTHGGLLGDGVGLEGQHAPILLAGGYTDWLRIYSSFWGPTCGMRANGKGYCWGSNDRGQIGDGTTTHRLSPTEPSGAYSDWTIVDAGDAHGCGIRGGKAYCWGAENWGGELGNGTNTSSLVPVQVTDP